MKTIIKFYLVNNDRKWKNYDECYNYHLAERFKYHNEYGKDGFLSERTYKDMIPMRAEQDAKQEWKKQYEKISGEIRSIQIKSEKQISEIENSEGFIRWINPKDDIPVRPPRESIKKIVEKK